MIIFLMLSFLGRTASRRASCALGSYDALYCENGDLLCLTMPTVDVRVVTIDGQHDSGLDATCIVEKYPGLKVRQQRKQKGKGW